MTVLIFLAACFFTIVMGAMMVLPFFQQREDQIKFEVLDEDLKEIEALTQKKALHVQQLMEIDDDLHAEKLTAADHAQLKRRYEREIILIMRRLDEIHGGQGWQERVQRARQVYHGIPEEPPSTDTTAPIVDTTHETPVDTTPAPTQDATEEEEGPENLDTNHESPGLLCERCLNPLSPQDRYCAQCGASAPNAQPTASLPTTAQEPTSSDDEVTTP